MPTHNLGLALAAYAPDVGHTGGPATVSACVEHRTIVTLVGMTGGIGCRSPDGRSGD